MLGVPRLVIDGARKLPEITVVNDLRAELQRPCPLHESPAVVQRAVPGFHPQAKDADLSETLVDGLVQSPHPVPLAQPGPVAGQGVHAGDVPGHDRGGGQPERRRAGRRDGTGLGRVPVVDAEGKIPARSARGDLLPGSMAEQLGRERFGTVGRSAAAGRLPGRVVQAGLQLGIADQLPVPHRPQVARRRRACGGHPRPRAGEPRQPTRRAGFEVQVEPLARRHADLDPRSADRLPATGQDHLRHRGDRDPHLGLLTAHRVGDRRQRGPQPGGLGLEPRHRPAGSPQPGRPRRQQAAQRHQRRAARGQARPRRVPVQVRVQLLEPLDPDPVTAQQPQVARRRQRPAAVRRQRREGLVELPRELPVGHAAGGLADRPRRERRRRRRLLQRHLRRAVRKLTHGGHPEPGARREQHLIPAQQQPRVPPGRRGLTGERQRMHHEPGAMPRRQHIRPPPPRHRHRRGRDDLTFAIPGQLGSRQRGAGVQGQADRSRQQPERGADPASLPPGQRPLPGRMHRAPRRADQLVQVAAGLILRHAGRQHHTSGRQVPARRTTVTTPARLRPRTTRPRGRSGCGSEHLPRVLGGVRALGE